MDGMATKQVVRLFAIFFFIKPWQTHKRTISILSERGWGGGGGG